MDKGIRLAVGNMTLYFAIYIDREHNSTENIYKDDIYNVV